MSIFEKVFNSLVVEGNERTAAQMANFYNTTPASIKARISELRHNAGFAVYANKRTDTAGRTKTFYRVGSPTKAVVAAGYASLAGRA
jgi:predicted ArsR family transcriptional regulator